MGTGGSRGPLDGMLTVAKQKERVMAKGLPAMKLVPGFQATKLKPLLSLWIVPSHLHPNPPKGRPQHRLLGLSPGLLI